jgi:thiaminase/transcriptional activator TenA
MMEIQKKVGIVLVCFIFFAVNSVYASNPPKTAAQLIQAHEADWLAATHHAFLEQVQDGSLPYEAFATWLGQDYHFASTLLDSQCLILANAPRPDQGLLIGGLFALDSELSWFEANAAIYSIDLTQLPLPTCRKYQDFLLALQYKPYVVQIICIWALEKAYFDSWSSALPGAPKYKEFIDRWTSDAFRDYVDGLEAAVDKAMAGASKEELAIADVYFMWIVRYEKDFWDMALTGQ